MTETCNMCGKSLSFIDINEDYHLNIQFGYGSKYDGEHIEARFCCECHDKLMDHLIRECKINPIAGEYI